MNKSVNEHDIDSSALKEEKDDREDVTYDNEEVHNEEETVAVEGELEEEEFKAPSYPPVMACTPQVSTMNGTIFRPVARSASSSPTLPLFQSISSTTDIVMNDCSSRNSSVAASVFAKTTERIKSNENARQDKAKSVGKSIHMIDSAHTTASTTVTTDFCEYDGVVMKLEENVPAKDDSNDDGKVKYRYDVEMEDATSHQHQNCMIPLKKRRVRFDGSTMMSSQSFSPSKMSDTTDNDNDNDNDKDDRTISDGLTHHTNLRRLVASCWKYYPYSTSLLPKQYYKIECSGTSYEQFHATDDQPKEINELCKDTDKISSVTNDTSTTPQAPITSIKPDWLAITKLPPTSGPYVYEDVNNLISQYHWQAPTNGSEKKCNSIPSSSSSHKSDIKVTSLPESDHDDDNECTNTSLNPHHLKPRVLAEEGAMKSRIESSLSTIIESSHMEVTSNRTTKIHLVSDISSRRQGDIPSGPNSSSSVETIYEVPALSRKIQNDSMDVPSLYLAETTTPHSWNKSKLNEWDLHQGESSSIMHHETREVPPEVTTPHGVYYSDVYEKKTSNGRSSSDTERSDYFERNNQFNSRPTVTFCRGVSHPQIKQKLNEHILQSDEHTKVFGRSFSMTLRGDSFSRRQNQQEYRNHLPDRHPIHKNEVDDEEYDVHDIELDMLQLQTSGNEEGEEAKYVGIGSGGGVFERDSKNGNTVTPSPNPIMTASGVKLAEDNSDVADLNISAINNEISHHSSNIIPSTSSRGLKYTDGRKSSSKVVSTQHNKSIEPWQI
jgi:hypothetical protein